MLTVVLAAGIATASLGQSSPAYYEATLSYEHDFFSERYSDWSFRTFELTRKNAYGSFSGYLQRARRFSQTGWQFGLRGYPVIDKKTYAYYHFGYSPAAIYPRYRVGFSVYRSLPHAFEISAGLRHLNFRTTRTTLYTASLFKYVGQYLFSASIYYAPMKAENSRSLNILVRRYLGNPRFYITAVGGIGSAAGHIRFAYDLAPRPSRFGGLQLHIPVGDRWTIEGEIGYEWKELTSFIRKRVNIKARISYRF